MFELTYEQGNQILMRESKFVRKAVIHYFKGGTFRFHEFSSPELLGEFYYRYLARLNFQPSSINLLLGSSESS